MERNERNEKKVRFSFFALFTMKSSLQMFSIFVLHSCEHGLNTNNERTSKLRHFHPYSVKKKKIKTFSLCRSFIRNKAGYTATPVACGWAGAVFELLEHLGRSSEAKDRKNIKKVKWGPTDGLTDGPTNRRTDITGCRVA